MKRIITLAAVVLISALYAFAMPPRPGVRPPAALVEAVNSGRIDNPSQGLLQEQLVKGGPAKISGSQFYPVVMGSFTDWSWNYSQSWFQTMLFSSASGVKSVNNYFRDMSYSAMSCSGRVDTWRVCNNTLAYYGGGNNGLNAGTTGNAYEFIWRTLAIADFYFDFSDTAYDRNHDGYVDVVWVVHAGFGGEETGGTDEIWSHSSSLNNWGGGATYFTTNDDRSGMPGTKMRINRYIIMPERTNASGAGNTMIGCGVFCHEFGHALGLPDLYDVAVNQSSTVMGEGLGLFSLMASGSWGGDYNSNATPAALDLWSRRFLGWCIPQLVTVNGTYTVNSIMATTTASSFKLAKQGQDTTRQYWLVENRSRAAAGPFSSVKWDTLLRGEGLAVYHIDTLYTSGSYFSANHVNSNSYDGISRNRPYGVALEETDDTSAGYHSELWFGYLNNYGEPVDLWNSGTQASFDSVGTSYPVSYLNGANSTTPGAHSGVSIQSIPAASAAMTCVLNVFPKAPELTISLLQNPAFTYSLGISMVSHFALQNPNNLDTANLTIDANPPVRLNFSHPSPSTFQASHTLQQAGNYKIRIVSKDVSDTNRVGDRLFTVSLAKATGGSVAALNGAVRLAFPAGAVAHDELWVICENTELTNPGAVSAGPAFQIGPDGRALSLPAELTLRYDPTALHGRDPARLGICELSGGQWRYRGGRLDAPARAVSAPITAAGVYQLCWSGAFPALAQVPAERLLSASPNPFGRATTIRYQLGAPSSVRLTVYNIAGQLIKTVIDGHQGAGAQAAVWDGRNDRDEDLPSGVYHYRLRIGDKAAVGRLVKVQ